MTCSAMPLRPPGAGQARLLDQWSGHAIGHFPRSLRTPSARLILDLLEALPTVFLRAPPSRCATPADLPIRCGHVHRMKD